MKIFIQPADTKRFTIDMAEDATIGHMKEEIIKHTNIKQRNQSLYFDSKQLDDDDRFISDYNIHKESILSLFTKKTGG